MSINLIFVQELIDKLVDILHRSIRLDLVERGTDLFILFHLRFHFGM